MEHVCKGALSEMPWVAPGLLTQVQPSFLASAVLLLDVHSVTGSAKAQEQEEISFDSDVCVCVHI